MSRALAPEKALKRKLDAALAKLQRQEAWLRGIIALEPTEISYDEFAYKRLVETYRNAARRALKGGQS